MHAMWKVGTASLVSALASAACASPSATGTVGYQQFRYTCCATSDVQRVWHPGQAFTLHWIVEPAGMTSDPRQHPLTLTAVLKGPYSNVGALKAAVAHAETLAATPIHVTDQLPGTPVSTIPLPRSLPAGWYNLEVSVDSAGGNQVGSSSVIHVAGSTT
jgi:hypothetical protein